MPTYIDNTKQVISGIILKAKSSDMSFFIALNISKDKQKKNVAAKTIAKLKI